MSGCAVSRRYIIVCICDVFSVVNVCLEHLRFCVGCIYGHRYVCCSECNVVSDECDEPTSCLLLLLLFAMIRSVVKSFKVPGVEVVASRMSNEAALTRMIDSTPKKTWSYLTLVLDG